MLEKNRALKSDQKGIFPEDATSENFKSSNTMWITCHTQVTSAIKF